MKILAPHLSCVVDVVTEENGLQEAIDAGYSMIYLICKDEIFLHKKLMPGRDGKQRFIRSKVTSIPGLTFPKIEQSVNFLPDGRIPIRLLHEVEAFFTQVIKVKESAVEAMIWIMWSQERGYFLHVPKQTVGGASARYDWDDLPEGALIVVDIHSHANFGAFFSGTDDRDDSNKVGFSGVIGHNASEKRSYAWRFNNKDQKTQVTMFDIFRQPDPEPVDVPEDWLNRVNLVQQSSGHGHGMGTYVGQGFQGWQSQNPHGYRGQLPMDLHNQGERSRHPFNPASSVATQGQNPSVHQTGPAGSVRNGNVVSAPHPTITHHGTTQSLTHHRPPQSPAANGGTSRPLTNADIPDEDQGFMIPTMNTSSTKEAGVSGLWESIEKTAALSPELQAMQNERFAEFAKRVQQEALLEPPVEPEEPSEEQILAHLRYVDAAEVTLTLDPTRGITVTIPKEELDAGVDYVAANFGRDAAVASYTIEKVAEHLLDVKELAAEAAQTLFDMVPDDEKLGVFRHMANSLPEEAKLRLAEGGL